MAGAKQDRQEGTKQGRKQRRKGWSYCCGERGTSRVRVYDRGARGIFLDFWEEGSDPLEPRRRVRMALGHSDRELAKQTAEETAVALRRHVPIPTGELTLSKLFETYLAEVTPHKGESKRKHDARAAEMFGRFFGASKRPRDLARRDWDRFIAARRAGMIAPKEARKEKDAKGKPTLPRTVGERVIAYDLRFMLAVLRWATIAGDGKGGTLLERNPWQGYPLPAPKKVQRPVTTADRYAAMRKVAAKVHPLFDALLVVMHETGHRMASVRQLRWSDVDLDAGTVLWRPENDKSGYEHRTPLTPAAVAMLERERARQSAIGDAWIFPSDRKPTLACSRSTIAKWWRRAEELAELPHIDRCGPHSLRRTFATELKGTPLADLCALGGWKDSTVILECYQQADDATMRTALEQRKQLSAAGLGG